MPTSTPVSKRRLLKKDLLEKPPKKKVKEIRLKVVGLPWVHTSTPTGSHRQKHLKIMWVHESATATMIEERIRREFGWKADQSFT